MQDLTIIMPSYNKEKYIGEALDSIFMQDTTYTYKVIIADDCSTDSTIEIAKEYQKKYPEKIEILTSDKNQKLYKNVLRAYEITKSDYFCVLDPDDYWIDKYKIQKMLDFLENNPEYTIYATCTDMVLKDGKRIPFINRKCESDYNFDEYLDLKPQIGCTPSTTFRNVIFKNGVPDKMLNLQIKSQEQSFRGDTFRILLHLHKGKVHCATDIDSIYRITDEGIWQQMDSLKQDIFNATIFRDIFVYFDEKHLTLLLHSLGFFNKSCNEFFDEIGNIKDEKTRLKLLNDIISLKEYFNSKKDILTCKNKTNDKKTIITKFLNILKKTKTLKI